MTLGNAAAAKLRLIVWCLDCRHRVDVDLADQVARFGADTTVPAWRAHDWLSEKRKSAQFAQPPGCARLVCGQCGSHTVDMVVSGEERRAEAPRLG